MGLPCCTWAFFSLVAGRLLIAVVPLAAEHGLSCSAARGILPDQGSNPCLLHWQADSQPLCHQGSPVIVLCVWSSVQNLSLKFLVNQEFLEILGLGRGFHLFGDNSALGHLPSWTSEFYWEGEGRDSLRVEALFGESWVQLITAPRAPQTKEMTWLSFLNGPCGLCLFHGIISYSTCSCQETGFPSIYEPEKPV